ncbi:MAG: alpha/beta fold hydrolase [Candidatus Lokiarchaeota archaeon]|nr:alpha/beta fold hydrolase [Candidatus Lokiarchaeota archaeon]
MKIRDYYHQHRILISFILLSICLSLLYINRYQSYHRYDRIRFESAGSTLYANLYYPSKSLTFQEKQPLVIYAHGIGNQRDFDIRIPIELTKRGFFVASIDYQGHGESEGTIVNIKEDDNIPALAQDCSVLLDYLENMDFYKQRVNTKQIGLVGHSLGGMVVLMNQALDDRFKATVCWAPLVNFDPIELGITTDKTFIDYIPVNLLNRNNTDNLLIIHHQYDEFLDFETHALKAQELTGCKVVKIKGTLLGGNHQLFSDEVLIETINWFESNFFNSKTINGPVHISFALNYFLLILSAIVLFLTVLNLMIALHSLFAFKTDESKKNKKSSKIDYSNPEIRREIFKILFYFIGFISIWAVFSAIFGLEGLIGAAALIVAIYFVVRSITYYRTPKDERTSIKKKITSGFEVQALTYAFLSTGILLGAYMVFSVSYPFFFVFPSNITYLVLANVALPIYLALEIFYRKVIYPRLSFISSRKLKTKIITLLAILNQILLIFATSNWSFIPAVFATYIIFLVVTIKNSIIYEKTQTFSAVLVSSIIIIQIFFGAAISTAIGINSALDIIFEIGL